ncbi:pyruvate oxidase [Acetilactobacillus jinshanensis]|uniref:Pyruvate oxidase n=1 Tax=Acetilactobacillus jinshanensis TaxID=1720083 RepID=A0A4P6ZKG4_9LACO|nr:pyruvate oxidase [Acetilactobacillus jinshanensis]QBP18148.1 pyruvate oxidase [Acetilactobacillus jinshanensis]URL61014.1 pyruvate oxidase [uncultured bacterium]
MAKKDEAYVIALKVLESYGVKDMFGYPAGSLNSLMHALDQEKNHMKYIQVRHEQVAALAASAHAKLTGKIGVCFGSAGPGAANLVNGLYDAKADHAPVLAIVGQVPNMLMNYDYFQEFPESPMFANIAKYNRIVMTPESLPHVINEAVKQAYKNQGVSVVVVPNNFGYVKIPEGNYTSAPEVMDKKQPEPKATHQEILQFLKLVKQAKRPVMHIGRGIKNNGALVVRLSKKLQIPVCADVLGKGLINPKYEGFLGSANRVADKPADEAISSADLVIAIGGDFSFSRTYYASHPFKYVQVDDDRSELGKHHSLDLGIWSDAGDFLTKALRASHDAQTSHYFQSLVADKQNWNQYLHHIQTMNTKYLHTQQLYYWINKLADPSAIYAVDTGNNTIDSLRYLNLYHHKWSLSALFATMGYGLPCAIAAQLDYPKHQVINLAGDGAMSMVMQDLVTLHKYDLPVLNIVTSNEDLGFIASEQQDAPMDKFGVDLQSQSFAGIAKSMGVNAVTIIKPSEVPDALKQALRTMKAGHPFLIDAKVVDERAIPVEDLNLHLDNGKFTEAVSPNYRRGETKTKHYPLQQFFNYYHGENLKSLPDIMQAHK